MATSGTLKTNTTYDSYFWVKWSIKGDQDIVNNKTTINWSCGVTPGHQFYSNAIKMSAVTINGEKVYSGGTYSNFTDYKEHTLGSGTLDIPHSTDGTKTFTISSFTGWLYGGYNYSASSTPYTLPTIPRASSISCTAAKIGNTATISITRASTDYTHTLRYVFGDLSGDIATTSNKVDTSASFTIPTTFYDKIPNAKSGTGTIYCKTYNDTTQIGDETNCKFTVTVDEATNKPTIAPTIQDSNNTTYYATGNRNRFVKGYSNASYTIDAQAKNGASIDSILITCGDLKGTTDSGVLNGVQSGTFKITVKDSRGFTVTQTIEKELVNYIPLTCVMDVSEISANGDVTITFRGNCYKGSLGYLTNQDYTHIMYKYKEEGGEYGSWSQIDFIPSDDNTYSETAQIHGLNHQKAYTFYAQVADAIEVNWIKLPEITRTSIPVFDWGKDDFAFHVPVNVDGDLNVKSGAIELNNDGSLSNYGGYIDFHFNKSNEDYTSRIIEDASGHIDIQTPNGLSVAGDITIGGHNSPIGSVLTTNGVQVSSNNALKNVTSLDIPEGVWIIIGGFWTQPPSSASASRIRITLGSSATTDGATASANNGYGTNTYALHGSGATIYGEVVTIRSGACKVYLNAISTAGTSINITGSIRAVRIA